MTVWSRLFNRRFYSSVPAAAAKSLSDEWWSLRGTHTSIKWGSSRCIQSIDRSPSGHWASSIHSRRFRYCLSSVLIFTPFPLVIRRKIKSNDVPLVCSGVEDFVWSICFVFRQACHWFSSRTKTEKKDSIETLRPRTSSACGIHHGALRPSQSWS